MLVEFLISNFEILIFFSIIFVIVGFLILFVMQNIRFQQNKQSIIDYANIIHNSNKELKDYLNSIVNVLELQKNEIVKITDKISFIEREINRLGNVKGSEDILGIAIDMARKGEDRESIKKKTGLREDEVEAIYTYYRK
jgi:predicted PurR-regulated permease PerM|tara:strand:- start:153 stop:569 length:417 start_codon:yes stop_codon:yes gene_type:complete